VTQGSSGNAGLADCQIDNARKEISPHTPRIHAVLIGALLGWAAARSSRRDARAEVRRLRSQIPLLAVDPASQGGFSRRVRRCQRKSTRRV
jgi:hypothetical protein